MIEFYEKHEGPLRIFRFPRPGYKYAMGLDTATGLGDDYSAAQVVSCTIPCEQVAVYREKLAVNRFAEIADRLGRFYNEALNICEINYPGNSVQDSMLQYYRYPNNYMPETHLTPDMDIADKYGYRTSDASKWILIEEFLLAMEQRNIIIYDVPTLDEMRNFVFLADKRKTGAAAGFNDDMVMALMLAHHAAKLNPVPVLNKAASQKKKKVDNDTKSAWRDFYYLLYSKDYEKGVTV